MGTGKKNKIDVFPLYAFDFFLEKNLLLRIALPPFFPPGIDPSSA